MSMEQAKLFIERMAKDEQFRTKIMAVDDVAERMKLVNAEGYDCTSEEIKNLSDLNSDDAVEGVAGGWIKCHSKGKEDWCFADLDHRHKCFIRTT